MLETKTTKLQATVVAISDSETPSLLLSRLLTRPDGGQKSISLSVPIREDSLLARAKHELQCGDEVDVVIETCWAEANLPKTLLDFSKVHAQQDQELSVSR